MDLAARIQVVTEEVVLRMAAARVHGRPGSSNLVPGRRRGAQLRRQRPAAARGAVRRHLDSAGRGRRRRRAGRRPVRLAPAARRSRARRHGRSDAQQGSLLGPGVLATTRSARFSTASGAAYRAVRRRRGELFDARGASCWPTEKVVGWFQGRMEFGPRALGAPQHHGDPRSATMQATMNLKIKFRESLPAVRAGRPARGRGHEYFEHATGNSPYMLLVAPVRGRTSAGAGPRPREQRGRPRAR